MCEKKKKEGELPGKSNNASFTPSFEFMWSSAKCIMADLHTRDFFAACLSKMRVAIMVAYSIIVSLLTQIA